jgi:formylglycine-generating enzyme required for sulfatase activity
MLVVQGGRFTMGRDKGEINERPSHAVGVDTFAMDRTEVAAGEFAEFLSAVGNAGDRYFTPDEHATVMLLPSGGGADATGFKARPGSERFPANNVSWFGADAYCLWRGKRLPTEAEWEKAARGTDRRPFPWGKLLPDESLARFGQVWQERQYGVFVPVDQLADGASPYGMLNMSGNVLEWVNDWYRQNLCDFCNPEHEANLGLVQQLSAHRDDPAAGAGAPASPELAGRQRQTPPRDNPLGPSAGSFKVLRGGSWQDRLVDDLAATRRFWLDPSQRFPYTGFRCVKELTREQSGPAAPRSAEH